VPTSVEVRAEKALPVNTFRPDIQGLRALAVIVVILDHLFGWPSGGFVGVDVFFVISGFLITGLMLSEHQRTGQISWANFYRRRVRRIMPAAVVCLTLTVAASFLIYRTARFDSIRSDAIWSLFFGANWHYAEVGTDYLGSTGPVSPLQHFWSLSVEEQFYIIWPVVLIGMLGVVGRPLRTRGRSANRALAAAMAAGVVGSFAWAVVDTATSPTWAYFSTFTRGWELAVGAMLAVSAPTIARLSTAGAPCYPRRASG
jgi:peptidoglycan/LPS O-acetylase OafA/YrhL